MEIKNIETEEVEFEIDDDSLRKIVDEKLTAFNMTSFDILPDKTKKRLIETEFFIQRLNKDIEKRVDLIKNDCLTRLKLSNSDITSYSRKTSYNDSVLNKYIEYSIKNEPDYFNARELNKIKNDYKLLKNLYDNLLDSIIDLENLKLQIKELEEDIISLNKDKDKLRIIIKNKDVKICELSNLLRCNNISLLKNKK